MNSLTSMAQQVRVSQRKFAGCEPELRTAALLSLADILERRSSDITAANERDLEQAAGSGLAAPLVSRLRLTNKKISTLCDGLKSLAQSADPVGRAERRTTLDDGLVLTRVMSPIGVLLIIFEIARRDCAWKMGKTRRVRPQLNTCRLKRSSYF